MLVDAPLKVVHKRRHVSASRPEGPAEPVHRNAMRSISFGVRASNLMMMMMMMMMMRVFHFVYNSLLL